ncbi:MAG TPA: hypothetical protein VFR41_15620 [Acidimicrobiia bacterium]|nr:hypothetical protein [Acidimicrobiia bacterium]
MIPALEDERMMRTWRWVGIGLTIAAALLLLTGAVYAWAQDGASARNRLEALSEYGANPFTGALLLTGILALIVVARGSADGWRMRPWFFGSFVLSSITVLLTLFSVYNAITVNNKPDSADFGGFVPHIDWRSRSTAVLARLAAGVIAALAMVLANRHAPASAPTESAGFERMND